MYAGSHTGMSGHVCALVELLLAVQGGVTVTLHSHGNNLCSHDTISLHTVWS